MFWLTLGHLSIYRGSSKNISQFIWYFDHVYVQFTCTHVWHVLICLSYGEPVNQISTLSFILTIPEKGVYPMALKISFDSFRFYLKRKGRRKKMNFFVIFTADPHKSVSKSGICFYTFIFCFLGQNQLDQLTSFFFASFARDQ